MLRLGDRVLVRLIGVSGEIYECSTDELMRPVYKLRFPGGCKSGWLQREALELVDVQEDVAERQDRFRHSGLNRAWAESSDGAGNAEHLQADLTRPLSFSQMAFSHRLGSARALSTPPPCRRTVRLRRAEFERVCGQLEANTLSGETAAAALRAAVLKRAQEGEILGDNGIPVTPEEVCGICLCTDEAMQKFGELCEHSFCVECLRDCAEHGHHTCPTCRAPRFAAQLDPEGRELLASRERAREPNPAVVIVAPVGPAPPAPLPEAQPPGPRPLGLAAAQPPAAAPRPPHTSHGARYGRPMSSWQYHRGRN